MGRAQERIMQLRRELYDTDEFHVKDTNTLQEHIDKEIGCGHVDRRTTYSDIDVVKQFSPDPVRYSAQAGGYYMEHGITPIDFLMMVERVAQSEILDETEIDRINELIEMQLYPEARKKLKSGIAVRFDRMVPRGDVCYTMRVLISAMEERKRIRFQYEIFDRHFRLIPKHDGQWYDISSYRFHFDDNTVYVYAGDATAGKKKTFRVERMVGVFMSDETMEKAEKYYGKRSEEEIRRQVNESVLHFDGDPIRLVLAVTYEPFIMEELWRMSRGTAKTTAEIDENTIRVEFDTRRGEPLFRMLASYADLIKVESPREVAEDIRNLLRSAKRTYGL